MSMRTNITEDNGKRYLYVPGVDFGTRLEIVKESKKAVIVKRNGHKAWNGIGHQTYYPPSFITFKYTKAGKEITDLGKEFEYSGRKKSARMEAFQKATDEFNHITKGKK